MYFVEHRKGLNPVKRETSAASSVEAVLAHAKLSARDVGADTIVIRGRTGRVAGVFATHAKDID